jgi:hypothetical protein
VGADKWGCSTRVREREREASACAWVAITGCRGR